MLDFYAPKLDLNKLRMPGDKVTIRVTESPMDELRKMFLYGSYTVGGRHAQIA